MTKIYFPGDCPIIDVFLLLSLSVLLVWVIIFSTTIIVAKYRNLKVPYKRIFMGIGFVSISCVILLCFIIGARNFGEWKELKKQLLYHSQRVENAVPEKDRMLTFDEFQKIKETLFSEPVFFKSESLIHPIQIRMMQTIPPYVGVDFGDGKNAVFELRTMFVTYSD